MQAKNLIFNVFLAFFSTEACIAVSATVTRDDSVAIVENTYYRATVAAEGGAIKSLMFKPTGCEITESTGIGSDIEATSASSGNATARYRLETSQRGAETCLNVSAKGMGGASREADIFYEKTYVFNDNSPVIKVKVRILNEGSPRYYGYRVKNILKVGDSCSGDTYFLQQASGMWERSFLPGKMNTNNFLKDFSSGWAGVTDPEKKTTVLYKADAGVIEQFYFWFGYDISTIEWYYKPVALNTGDVFETTYFILPLQNVAANSDALRTAVELTRGIEIKTEVTTSPKSADRTQRTSPLKVLIAGSRRYGVNLNDSRRYNIEPALSSLSFLKIENSEVVRPGYTPYEGDRLINFPISPEGLSEYRVIVLIDVPAWALMEKDRENLLAYVEKGGAIIFVGDHARGYEDTALGEIYPLVFDHTKEVKGWGGKILQDKTDWLMPSVDNAAHPVTRGLPADMPEVVVHKSVLKKGNVILKAGEFPLLAETDYGKGRVLSFPVSLTAKVNPNSAWPDGEDDYGFLDDKFFNWDFYGRLWRNIILYCLQESPSVDFKVVAPPDKILIYPSEAGFSGKIANFSGNRQDVSISMELFKNDGRLKDENLSCSLLPGEEKDIVFRINPSGIRGDYLYRVIIRNAENIFSVCGGTFSVMPKVHLEMHMPFIKVFGKNSSVDFDVAAVNIDEENRYRVRTRLTDFRGKTVGEARICDVSGTEEKINLSLPLGNLMKGTYGVTAELLEGEKTIDVVEDNIFIVPRLEEGDCYPNIIMSGRAMAFDRKEIALEIEKMKEVGFNGIYIYNWASYREKYRNLSASVPDFHAYEEAQKSGMLFCAPSWYGQSSWNRFYKGCPNTAVTGSLLESDITGMDDYLSLYMKSPRQLAVYIADEPGTDMHRWKTCETCRREFEKKYGYSMPTDMKDRNYYVSYRFMLDSYREYLAREIAFIRKANPEFRVSAALNLGGSLAGFNNLGSGIISLLDIPAVDHYRYGDDPYTLDLLWGLSGFRNSIMLIGTTSTLWGSGFPAPYLGTQVYNALCHNAKGLYWYIWKEAFRDTMEDAERIEYGRKAFRELEYLGPFFMHLTRQRANALMLHPTTALVMNPSKRLDYLANLENLHRLSRETFGSINIIDEEQVQNGDFLSGADVLVIPADTTHIQEETVSRIIRWVKDGGLMIMMPQPVMYNEYQEETSRLLDIMSVSYGKDVSMQVEGAGALPVKGRVVNPVKAKVIYRYADGEAAVTETACGQGRIICFGFVPKTGVILKSVTGGAGDSILMSDNENIDNGLFIDNDTRYIVAVNQQQKAQKANLRLSVPKATYHVFDLLTGQELGYSYGEGCLCVPLEFECLWGRVLVVLKEKPAKLLLSLDDNTCERGKKLAYTVKLLTDRGKVLNAKMPVEVTVTDSEGRKREEYGGVRVTDKGVFVKKIILADNDPVGTWRIEIKERISGELTTAVFTVN